MRLGHRDMPVPTTWRGTWWKAWGSNLTVLTELIEVQYGTVSATNVGWAKQEAQYDYTRRANHSTQGHLDKACCENWCKKIAKVFLESSCLKVLQSSISRYLPISPQRQDAAGQCHMALVIPGQTWESRDKGRDKGLQWLHRIQTTRRTDVRCSLCVISTRVGKIEKNMKNKTSSSSSKYLGWSFIRIHPQHMASVTFCHPSNGQKFIGPAANGKRLQEALSFATTFAWNILKSLRMSGSALEFFGSVEQVEHVSTSGAGRCRAQLSGLVQTIPVRQTPVSRESWDWFASKAICVEWVMSNASNAILQRNSMEIILTQIFSHLQSLSVHQAYQALLRVPTKPRRRKLFNGLRRHGVKSTPGTKTWKTPKCDIIWRLSTTFFTFLYWSRQMLREQESSSQFRMCQETEAKVDLLPQVSKLWTNAKHQITSAPWIHLIHHPHFVLRTSITIGTWVLMLSAAPSIRRSRKVVTGPPVFSKLPTSEELFASFCAISRYQPLSSQMIRCFMPARPPSLSHFTTFPGPVFPQPSTLSNQLLVWCCHRSWHEQFSEFPQVHLPDLSNRNDMKWMDMVTWL